MHEDDLGPATLKKYSALLLPNVAALGDAQCAQLRDYVQSGGSLLGNFETSGYNEWGVRRDLPGSRMCSGSSPVTYKVRTATRTTPESKRPHPILKDFEGTKVLPGAEYRLRVKSDAALVLSVVQPYPAFPPRWFTRVSAHS